MGPDATLTLFGTDNLVEPSGDPNRFTQRWRLIAAGVSNVWRYGDLILDAATGRLLLRGPNGTGKTTLLEGLWPYLLDLNAQRLSAGKARPTTLSSLMREGATGKRRCGFLWLTFAAPAEEGIWSYGAKLLYTEGSSPQVKVTPFMAAGMPLQDFPLYGPNREQLAADEFERHITSLGGQVFDDEEDYVTHLANRVWRTGEPELADLATRLRAVRNPTLLGAVSPREAADALRDSLPSVSDDVVAATADALAESETTRTVFRNDSTAADAITQFAQAWGGHVVDVVGNAHQQLHDAVKTFGQVKANLRRLEKVLKEAEDSETEAGEQLEDLKSEHRKLTALVAELGNSAAFKNAGRLADLKNTWTARQDHAGGQMDLLEVAARSAASRAEQLHHAVAQLHQDLEDLRAQALAVDGRALDNARDTFTSTTKPRAVYQVRDRFADAGPHHTITVNDGAVDDTVARWKEMAQQHRTRAHDARLAHIDHQEAKEAQDAADAAGLKSRELRGQAEKTATEASKARRRAAEAAQTLLQEADEWARRFPQLAAADLAALTADLPNSQAEQVRGDDIELWETHDLVELRVAEPAQIIAEMDRWASQTNVVANAAAQAHHFAGETLRAQGRELAGHATKKREDAAKLRAGKLLPVPRPAWCEPGDDDQTVAMAVDWHHSVPEGTPRALIEAALSASGLLGATITASDVRTEAWTVTATGNTVAHNLTSVLTVDPSHPHADIVMAVLNRIGLADSAERGDTNTLIVGRDGTFRIGPLHGRPALVGTDLAQASHVGARQRRQAALEHADELDRAAGDLDQQADHRKQLADGHAATMRAMRNAAGRFPARSTARARETERAAVAAAATDADKAASAAESAAAEKSDTATLLQQEWKQRTAARGLPVTITELEEIADTGDQHARRLTELFTMLDDRLRPRLRRLAAEAAADTTESVKLPTLHLQAKRAADNADSAGAEYEALRIAVGADAETAVTDHATAKDDLADNAAAQDVLQDALRDASRRSADTRARIDEADKKLTEAGPRVDQLREELMTLLDVPGARQVLFNRAAAEPEKADAVSADTATVERIQEPTHASDSIDALLETVAAAVSAFGPTTRRMLRERYDQCRTTLAGIWTLDPGETVKGLDTFVLIHDNIAYTPPAAATRAEQLRRRAQQALDAAEESALDQFVIGRLPHAIGAAWQSMHDWVIDVNKKMKRASASSGVGVRVSMALSKDLPAAAYTVHKLCCLSSHTDHTSEQRAEAGAALQALIAAADGDTMAGRVTDAIDIRSWVTLTYEITRPGAEPQRWTSKTGLSGGERRLVVLAPMLAAVAATYDRLDAASLRLVALDEVPAEVDERGREGLARFIAELDLDLICTSYLWDGAPGAWDGIDAWDLEAAADGTVIGFPMLIRSLEDIPGDQTETPA
ncbi:SbcC/MukB-like Walker B domain-containing protein [Micromonospora sp. WMMD710]|uniref:SbcC/MukB-like Walker B domain-containing protein n=1 Tax=Micromonospora sp. WMMD710 TaxID=3016085 RepID=UPI002415AB71|nr:SbcC/MukB-like Walker B domain-containing protein [Micromonospora sp. WMMD710]MDG4760325.1 SbcC/MukB-like Walker B domain-containing protein [Micromonospora sp. WMMD710]